MLNLSRRRLTRGFSLLELLVVISIIGILMAMGAVAFTTVQKKGRDARRQGDIKAMGDALEQYYAEFTTYTGSCAAIGTYMPGGIPLDPKTGVAYTCDDTLNAGADYCVTAELDNTTGGNCEVCDATGANKTHYCQHARQ